MNSCVRTFPDRFGRWLPGRIAKCVAMATRPLSRRSSSWRLPGHIAAFIVAATLLCGGAAVAQNIDPAGVDARFVYGENTGWIDVKPTSGLDVTVSSAALTGFVYGENVGWINLSPTGGGVANDGTGRLSGFAWGENIGWINFAPTWGGVRINACGQFSGYAYGENVGWIFFGPGAQFRLATSWVSSIDLVAPVTVATVPAPYASGWYADSAVFRFAATDCGSGVREIRTRLDARPEVLTAGAIASTTVVDEGIHTLTYYAVDRSNNLEMSRAVAVRIDRTAPTVSITSPAEGATIAINQPVAAAFTADDAQSGVAGIVASVPNGSPIATSSPGLFAVSVTATDRAGNVTSASRSYTVMYPGNIDPTVVGGQFAYGENVGWVNLRPSWGPGVTVTRTAMTGLAYAENVGWINLAPTGAGVMNDGTGRLSGFAYGENIGWIDFGPAGGGVTIDPATGRFAGFAYSENVGWMNFGATGAAPLTTAWIGTDTIAPVVTPPAPATIAATEAAGARGGASAPLATFLAAGSATDDRDPQPGRLPALANGSAVNDVMLFPMGATTVTFRFGDQSGNVGTATTTATVILGQIRVAGTIVGKGMDAGASYVDLRIVNSGTGNARDLRITELLPRTLAGSGAVTLNAARNPTLPIVVNSLPAGQATTMRIYLDVPPTVTRFSLTENGTVVDVAGTLFRYSTAQAIVP